MNPKEYYLGRFVQFTSNPKNKGIVLSPIMGRASTTLITVKFLDGEIRNKVPIDQLTIIEKLIDTPKTFRNMCEIQEKYFPSQTTMIVTKEEEKHIKELRKAGMMPR